ncbi:MAG: toll/interleukin-1 receptor domain-containing protein [Oscillospiraceae bacterium]|jgi:hypothetical protein|nr:toll/interleukin-1 receptor domain-containing protein [Oscillospiraceae bacterium]
MSEELIQADHAYEGAEPYVFVSYSHEDKAHVYPIIAQLQKDGYRVWYDEGIKSGDWVGIITKKSRKAKHLIVFMSEAAQKSEWVKTELTVAKTYRVPIVAVFLAPFSRDELNDSFFGLLITSTHQYSSEYPTTPDLIREIKAGIPPEVKAGENTQIPVNDPPDKPPDEKTNDNGSKKPGNAKLPQKGDIIQLGSYQGKPVQWLVLQVKKDKREVLLLSKDCMEYQVYDHLRSPTAWANCSLQRRLNTAFYRALNTENKRIIRHENENPKNFRYNTPGSPVTKDDVFCLSIDQAETAFPTDTARICCFANAPTKWWLRSPGSSSDRAAYVDEDGRIQYAGEIVNSSCGVRPAMWVKW